MISANRASYAVNAANFSRRLFMADRVLMETGAVRFRLLWVLHCGTFAYNNVGSGLKYWRTAFHFGHALDQAIEMLVVAEVDVRSVHDEQRRLVIVGGRTRCRRRKALSGSWSPSVVRTPIPRCRMRRNNTDTGACRYTTRSGGGGFQVQRFLDSVVQFQLVLVEGSVPANNLSFSIRKSAIRDGPQQVVSHLCDLLGPM